MKAIGFFPIYIFILWIKGSLFNEIVVPNLNGYCYLERGHVNIGVLVALSDRGNQEMCSDKLASARKPQSVEIVKYAMMEVNAREDILPNITLGYSIVDTCNRDIVALARSLCFIHDSDDNREQWINSTATLDELPTSYKCAEASPIDVVGIIGPRTSRESVVVSSLLSLFQIPVLAPYSISDELSDKSGYEYFMRPVPLDSYQAQAIVDVCVHYGWTYISLLYSEGSYGENGEKQIEKETNKKGVCIAYIRKIPYYASDQFYEETAKRLMINHKARVVVTFLEESHAKNLFQIVNKVGVDDYFVWIGSDSLSLFQHVHHVPSGILSMQWTMNICQPFSDYYKYLTPFNSSNNIWLYCFRKIPLGAIGHQEITLATNTGTLHTQIK